MAQLIHAPFTASDTALILASDLRYVTDQRQRFSAWYNE